MQTITRAIASVAFLFCFHLMREESLAEASRGEELKPRYDFLYVAGSDCLHGTKVRVVSGRLHIDREAGARDTCDRPAQLLRYHVEKGAAEVLSLEQAGKLMLQSEALSPDGFRLKKLERSALTTMERGSLTYQTQLCLQHEKTGAHYPVAIRDLIFPDESSRGFSNAEFIGWVQE